MLHKSQTEGCHWFPNKSSYLVWLVDFRSRCSSSSPEHLVRKLVRIVLPKQGSLHRQDNTLTIITIWSSSSYSPTVNAEYSSLFRLPPNFEKHFLTDIKQQIINFIPKTNLASASHLASCYTARNLFHPHSLALLHQ